MKRWLPSSSSSSRLVGRVAPVLHTAVRSRGATLWSTTTITGSSSSTGCLYCRPNSTAAAAGYSPSASTTTSYRHLKSQKTLWLSSRSPSPSPYLSVFGHGRKSLLAAFTAHAFLFRCKSNPTQNAAATRRWFASTTTPTPNTSSTTSSSKDNVLITYLTDVEGDASYLKRFVQQSRVLKFVPVQPRWGNTTSTAQEEEEEEENDHLSSCRKYFPYDHCINLQNENAHFIYGGDAWDKGGSDLYVIRQLLDLKRRYPTRVHFIMGNRDINKMRISQELRLHDSNNDAHLPNYDGVYWLNHPKAKALFPHVERKPPTCSAADRLRWILGKTMGSPHAFELRRLELQAERQTQARYEQREEDIIITDDNVVQSYRESCHPVTGEMGQYLASANLVLRIGDLMVLHGALPLTRPILQHHLQQQQQDSSVSFWSNLDFARPWRKGTISDNNLSHSSPDANQAIQSWMEDLNAFAKQSIHVWKNRYCTTCTNGTTNNSNHQIWAVRGGYGDYHQDEGSLIQYGMGWTPDGQRNPTVVYSSWGVDGIPNRISNHGDTLDRDHSDDENQLFVHLIQDFFQQSGIQLILAGHQPQGDLPTPIRYEYNKDDNDSTKKQLGWVLCCDTSYSGDIKWWKSSSTDSSIDPERINPGRGKGPSFRGDLAVSETLVEMDHQGRILDVYYHGVLSDGTQYQSESLPMTTTAISEDARDDSIDLGIGMFAVPNKENQVPSTEDTPHQRHWWTKGHLKLPSSSSPPSDTETKRMTLLTTAKGFDVHNCLIQTSAIPKKQ